jgi:Spy/CpxP family protein refolding chaperone
VSGRTKIVMTAAFALALCAGVAVGMLGARLPEKRGEPRSWLADELQLTAEQREKMKAIWSEVSKGREESGEKRRAIEKERTDALKAFLGKLSPEQRTEYESISQKFQQDRQELDRERDTKFKEAERQTEEMLTPEQREKYKALREKRREGRGDGRGGPGPGPGGPDGFRRGGRRGGGGGGGGGGPPGMSPVPPPDSSTRPTTAPVP